MQRHDAAGHPGEGRPLFQLPTQSPGLSYNTSDLLSLAQRLPQLGAQQVILPSQDHPQTKQAGSLHHLLQQVLQHQQQSQQQASNPVSLLQPQPVQLYQHLSDSLLSGLQGLPNLQPQLPLPPQQLQQVQRQLQAAAALGGTPLVGPGAGGPPGSEDVPFSLGPTGLKLRVLCNDVRGILYLDDQFVSCFCADCEARVRAGHDRPIFGLSRFEKHCGSKAKKWRTSLRVEPGSCPEVKLSDPPMPVGHYLAMKGMGIKGKGKEDNDSDQEFMPSPKAKRAKHAERRAVHNDTLEDGRELSPGLQLLLDSRGAAGNVATTLLHLRQEGGSGAGGHGVGWGAAASRDGSPRTQQMNNGAFSPDSPQRQAAAAGAPAAAGPTPMDTGMEQQVAAQQAQVASGSGAAPALARERSLYHRGGGAGDSQGKLDRRHSAADTSAGKGLGNNADGANGSSGQAAGTAVGGDAAAAMEYANALLISEDSIPVSPEWLQQQRQRFRELKGELEGSGEGGAALTGAAAVSAKHGAIFHLVFGLLEQPNQRLFSEQYMPWLNDLSPARLDREFASLAFYLELLEELPWKAVWRQIVAYLQGMLRRIALLPSAAASAPSQHHAISPPRSPSLYPEVACHGSLPHRADQQRFPPHDQLLSMLGAPLQLGQALSMEAATTAQHSMATPAGVPGLQGQHHPLPPLGRADAAPKQHDSWTLQQQAQQGSAAAGAEQGQGARDWGGTSGLDKSALLQEMEALRQGQPATTSGLPTPASEGLAVLQSYLSQLQQRQQQHQQAPLGAEGIASLLREPLARLKAAAASTAAAEAGLGGTGGPGSPFQPFAGAADAAQGTQHSAFAAPSAAPQSAFAVLSGGQQSVLELAQRLAATQRSRSTPYPEAPERSFSLQAAAAGAERAASLPQEPAHLRLSALREALGVLQQRQQAHQAQQGAGGAGAWANQVWASLVQQGQQQGHEQHQAASADRAGTVTRPSGATGGSGVGQQGRPPQAPRQMPQPPSRPGSGGSSEGPAAHDMSGSTMAAAGHLSSDSKESPHAPEDLSLSRGKAVGAGGQSGVDLEAGAEVGAEGAAGTSGSLGGGPSPFAAAAAKANGAVASPSSNAASD
ncbi:hypothetical protein N2152v2_010936 [Parachlorella kessleri]